MKKTFTHVLPVFLAASLWQAAGAQTVTTTPENWSTLIPSGSCTGCTITIPTGYTLVLNTSSGSCDGCTFTGGGTVTVSAAFKFPNHTTTFDNLAVYFNSTPGSLKNLNFSNDTIAVNSALTYSSGPTEISNSRISVSAPLKFSTANFDGDSIHLNSTISFTSSTDTFQNSHVTLANASQINAQAALFSNNVFTSTGSAYITTTGSLTSSNDSFYLVSGSKLQPGGVSSFADDVISLSGNSSFVNFSGATFSGGSVSVSGTSLFSESSSLTSTNTAFSFSASGSATVSSNVSMTGGSLTLTSSASFTAHSSATFNDADVTVGGNTSLAVSSTLKLINGSDLTVGDNTGTSTAKVTSSGLQVLGNSFVGIAAGSNSIKVSSGSYTDDHGSVTIGSSAITGCATLSNSGSNTCVVLAVSDLTLNASHAGDGKIALSWTDKSTAPADRYLVQRNTGGLDWTTIATIDAAAAGANYHFLDQDAPAGTIDYRIARVGSDGMTLYSPVSAVTAGDANSGAVVGIHPNPAVGGTFYVTTSNTGHVLINIYTMTGQLLLHTEGNGQTQYPVHLPAQAVGSGAVVVQTILQGVTRSFTVIAR
ncbi:MAG TPA: hypothetical protein VHE54_10475 [Puia sp.]|nr:hypothetical protein [Puia sp.]